MESLQEYKSEYYAGEVFAQAGASSKHTEIAGNLFALVHSHLKGKACRAYIADMKLHVSKVDAFFYPDVMVTCDSRDRSTDMYKQYPVIIAEVLSESTADYDRTFKFACYQKIDTLRDYLLISQDVFSVEHFHLNTLREWVRTIHSVGETFHLGCLDLDVAVSDVYADVDGVVTLEEKYRKLPSLSQLRQSQEMPCQ
ncbi:MAG TPA: Uma2 family endonuclease [Desulfuromonadales bacterium]|nr:Uma2 family endonuclease [Desulfuromonadales bacterium]